MLQTKGQNYIIIYTSRLVCIVGSSKNPARSMKRERETRTDSVIYRPCSIADSTSCARGGRCSAPSPPSAAAINDSACEQENNEKSA